MSDIVVMARAAEKDERLSDGALYGKLADEIERLRAALLEIDRVAYKHTKGGIGIAQRIAREALNGTRTEQAKDRR